MGKTEGLDGRTWQEKADGWVKDAKGELIIANQTKGRKNAFVSVTREEDALVVALANGWTRKTEPKKYPEVSRDWALFHGANQRIRDSVAALSKDLQWDKAQTELNAVIDALESGQIRRERATSLGFHRDDVIQGLMKVNKVDREQAEKVVAEATPEKIREVIQKRPDFKVAIVEAQMARLKAEAKASPTDTGKVTF